MEDKDFGARLKAVRLAAKKTVAEVSAYLTSLGRKASEKERGKTKNCLTS